MVRSGLDENVLRYIANSAGGSYSHVLSPSDFQLGSMISSVDAKYKKGEQEIFYYPLMLAVLFFVLAVAAPLESKAEQPKPGVSSNPTLRRRPTSTR